MNLLDALYLPAAVVTAPWWARKTRGGWSERFGRIGPLPPQSPGRKRVLLHAVSVGEVNTLRALVPMLSRESDVVVSATTDTGLARARALFEPAGAEPVARVVRYPLDFSPAVERFLDAVRPDAVALVELELWPNFVARCGARGVPVCVINGRLSARSFRGYHRFRSFFAKTFGALEFAAVQDSAYAQRFVAMGVPESRVRITGSMKWDSVSLEDTAPGAKELAETLGIDPSRPLIVAGSTAELPGAAESEERLLHEACPAGVQLLCAPRRPERFDAAFETMGGTGHCVRRTAAADRTATRSNDRFLLDTIGELRAAYALADIAVIGRSFGGLHGSDPIEPIALGRPTVMGPHYANFEAIVAAFREAGALEIVEPSRLGQVLAHLLADPTRRAAMAKAGRACVRAHQGATAVHADMILHMAGARTASAERS
ncbi:MAG: hypothetical protein KF699_11120 [Phycisphaeraceae bacterium]|nr:hypothetical protein [Phycisphaeraceae bacterium]